MRIYKEIAGHKSAVFDYEKTRGRNRRVSRHGFTFLSSETRRKTNIVFSSCQTLRTSHKIIFTPTPFSLECLQLRKIIFARRFVIPSSVIINDEFFLWKLMVANSYVIIDRFYIDIFE